RRKPPLVDHKQKEFCFDTGKHIEAETARFFQILLQPCTWTTAKRTPVRVTDIANQTSNFAPFHVFEGENPERPRIRLQQHVRLFDSGEPFDSRSVKHNLPVQRLFKLTFGDLDILVAPHDVGKLKSHKADSFFAANL